MTENASAGGAHRGRGAAGNRPRVPSPLSWDCGLLVGAALLLTACTGPPALPDGTVVIATVPTFCYETLAEPECLPLPEPGQAARFIGAGVGTRTFIVDDGILAPLP